MIDLLLVVGGVCSFFLGKMKEAKFGEGEFLGLDWPWLDLGWTLSGYHNCAICSICMCVRACACVCACMSVDVCAKKKRVLTVA